MVKADVLSEIYCDWVTQSYDFQQIDDSTVRIDLPFLDNFSDEIVIYAVDLKNDKILLTDDGWTMSNLKGMGVEFNKSSKRRDLLVTQTQVYG